MARLGAGRIALAAWVVLGAVATAPRAEDEAVSRRVSDDAVIYVEVPRPAVLLERATDPRFRALVEALPGLKAALDRPDIAKLRDAVQLISERLGKSWQELAKELTAGGMVLAIEAPRARAPETVLVVTPSDPALLKKANDLLLELANKDAADRGADAAYDSAEHRGIRGYAPKGSKAAYAIVKGRLILADRSETLKTAIDRALDGLPADRSVERVEAWKTRKAAANGETAAWGLARLDLLRDIDPNRFKMQEKADGGATLLFAGWLETLRKAPWIGATLKWTDKALGAELAMPAPPGGRGASLQGYIPPKGEGAPALFLPPGTLMSASLWRDLSAAWEARADLFRPEDVQNLAKLDTFAGQFFGGRDFGSGVLGALTADWRLVVALQDFEAMDPVPDVKLPAFALIATLKPDDDEFAQRLKVAFQTFVGLANIGATQAKSPPLELMSETFEGVTISTTRFMPAPGAAKGKENAKDAGPVHQRHNFSPSAVHVGDHFVLSSSRGLARDLVKSLKAGAAASAPDEAGTFVAKADGAALATLVEKNRPQLVMRNILEKGNDEARAGAEVDLLASLLRYLGQGRLGIQDGSDLMRVTLDFDLGR